MWSPIKDNGTYLCLSLDRRSMEAIKHAENKVKHSRPRYTEASSVFHVTQDKLRHPFVQKTGPCFIEGSTEHDIKHVLKCTRTERSGSNIPHFKKTDDSFPPHMYPVKHNTFYSQDSPIDLSMGTGKKVNKLGKPMVLAKIKQTSVANCFSETVKGSHHVCPHSTAPIAFARFLKRFQSKPTPPSSATVTKTNNTKGTREANETLDVTGAASFVNTLTDLNEVTNFKFKSEKLKPMKRKTCSISSFAQPELIKDDVDVSKDVRVNTRVAHVNVERQTNSTKTNENEIDEIYLNLLSTARADIHGTKGAHLKADVDVKCVANLEVKLDRVEENINKEVTLELIDDLIADATATSREPSSLDTSDVALVSLDSGMLLSHIPLGHVPELEADTSEKSPELTPFLKEELKWKIQYKRLTRGESELLLQAEPAKEHKVSRISGINCIPLLTHVLGLIELV